MCILNDMKISQLLKYSVFFLLFQHLSWILGILNVYFPVLLIGLKNDKNIDKLIDKGSSNFW